MRVGHRLAVLGLERGTLAAARVACAGARQQRVGGVEIVLVARAGFGFALQHELGAGFALSRMALFPVERELTIQVLFRFGFALASVRGQAGAEDRVGIGVSARVAAAVNVASEQHRADDEPTARAELAGVARHQLRAVVAPCVRVGFDVPTGARAGGEAFARNGAAAGAGVRVGKAHDDHAGFAFTVAVAATDSSAEGVAVVRKPGAEISGFLRRRVAQDEIDGAAGAGGKFGRAAPDDLDAFDQFDRQAQRVAVAARQRPAVHHDARLQPVGRPGATAPSTFAFGGEAHAGQLPQDVADGRSVHFFQVFAADDDLRGRGVPAFVQRRVGLRGDMDGFQGRRRLDGRIDGCLGIRQGWKNDKRD